MGPLGIGWARMSRHRDHPLPASLTHWSGVDPELPVTTVGFRESNPSRPRYHLRNRLQRGREQSSATQPERPDNSQKHCETRSVHSGVGHKHDRGPCVLIPHRQRVLGTRRQS